MQGQAPCMPGRVAGMLRNGRDFNSDSIARQHQLPRLRLSLR
eukprot:CAMPEP_0206481494 /NCGR_PEP_ID=MMETSP0324_2-20121206/38190_1 /ASSEMBLY_ACC=CAM_ASM_000836 /TAXON_ID=2866 /ORGANISM="Crypthecodinium cohnii, Strain Seligo" /LENGTH=41 /DNA_ID= /DNA_START= /DNA_END= /DNA_ORIENTATION=